MRMSLPPIANQFGLDQRGRVLETPTSLQRAGIVLAFAATFLVPSWLAFGRFALIGGGGWFMIMIMMAAGVVFIIYVAILVFTIARTNKVRPGAAGRPTTWFLLASMLLAFPMPALYEDFGDTSETSPSILQIWFGVSSEVTGVVFVAFAGLFAASLVGALITAIIAQHEADKTAQQRLAQMNAALSHQG